MPRIQGLSETGILTSESQVKAVEGYVFSITAAYTGCAAGNIFTLRDSANGMVSGHDEVPFCLPATNGTLTKEWVQGKKFDNGIFLNFHDILLGGALRIEMTYK